ncbi:hypothetical protein HJC23_007944 [Cyclotella cryptica]|uniref:Uncharacterized protein n=1 Tax=Cyclotella cryptica TaxID=29204 RepID=A0ABD3PAB9_9STRA|eukprot:CCRYP_016219-RA/>CCRYP_016219-RA protein AED:0.13 eAED:0.13 QI:0/-1/0/1/-1/1/1/0/705
MASSKIRKPHTVVAPPPPPRRVPIEQRSPPPATITIPISIGKVDEPVYQTFHPPHRTNSRDVHKNVCPKDGLSGRSASCPDELTSIDEVNHRHDKLSGAMTVDANDNDDPRFYSEYLRDILDKSDSTVKDAENMLKLLDMDKLDEESSFPTIEESEDRFDSTWRKESLDSRLGDPTYFREDPIVSSVDIEPEAFETLKMLYGQDSFHLTQNRAPGLSKPSPREASAIEDNQLVSNRQSIALFPTESSSFGHVDPSYLEDSPHGKNSASSSRDLVCSRQGLVRRESSDILCPRRIGRESPVRGKQLNTLIGGDSNRSPDSCSKLAPINKPTHRRDLLIRSRSCDIVFDSSEVADISPLTHHPTKVKSTRHARANSSQFKRTRSEGTGMKPKVVPPPPPHPRKKSTPLPQLTSHSKRPNPTSDRNSNEGEYCLAGSYDDMMSLAHRMSSERSLGEPSILKSPTDEQYWRILRGKPKSKKQMRGRGQSAKKNRIHGDNYDSCGEMSGAETSQNSRKSKNTRRAASRLRKMEDEKRRQELMQEKCKPLNGRSQSLDKLCSGGRHQQCRGDRNHTSSLIVTKKKSGIACLFQRNKDRLANSIGRSATGSTDIISGSVSTTDSRSTRKSPPSWDGRKSFESRPSKKSTKSLLFSKRRVMDSGTILSAAADIFQHQCIQVNINKTALFHDEASCDSSLSCYSEDTFDFENNG